MTKGTIIMTKAIIKCAIFHATMMSDIKFSPEYAGNKTTERGIIPSSKNPRTSLASKEKRQWRTASKWTTGRVVFNAAAAINGFVTDAVEATAAAAVAVNVAVVAVIDMAGGGAVTRWAAV